MGRRQGHEDGELQGQETDGGSALPSGDHGAMKWTPEDEEKQSWSEEYSESAEKEAAEEELVRLSWPEQLKEWTKAKERTLEDLARNCWFSGRAVERRRANKKIAVAKHESYQIGVEEGKKGPKEEVIETRGLDPDEAWKRSWHIGKDEFWRRAHHCQSGTLIHDYSQAQYKSLEDAARSIWAVGWTSNNPKDERMEEMKTNREIHQQGVKEGIEQERKNPIVSEGSYEEGKAHGRNEGYYKAMAEKGMLTVEEEIHSAFEQFCMDHCLTEDSTETGWNGGVQWGIQRTIEKLKGCVEEQSRFMGAIFEEELDD